MRTLNKVLLNATTLAGTTPVTSAAIKIEHIYTLALQLVSTGANGSLQIQVSCDAGKNNDEDGVSVVNWGNLGAAIANSGAGTTFQNFDGIGYKWLRVIFTPAAGSGVMTVTANCKGN